MLWALAHRPRLVYEATDVVVEATTSWDAIELVREQAPEGHLVLFVRRVD